MQPAIWIKYLLGQAEAIRRVARAGSLETDASVADDLELCDLLSEAGCRQLLIGF